MAPDGNVEWLLSIESNRISSHCLRYNGWPEVWSKQQRFIKAAFNHIGLVPVALSSAGMKWIDQFLHTGTVEEYRADDLLRKKSPYLHERAFSSGPRWHCHTGWFDAQLTKDYEVLNQLNVNSGLVNVRGNQRLAVTIDHTTQLRAETTEQLSAFAPGGKEPLTALSGLMETLHRANKDVLRNLLTDVALDRVGLQMEI